MIVLKRLIIIITVISSDPHAHAERSMTELSWDFICGITTLIK